MAAARTGWVHVQRPGSGRLSPARSAGAGAVTHPPRDLTPLPDLLHGAARAGPVRTRRPVYLDLLPPCNAGCPAGENIQAWLGFTQAGQHERAWRQLVADNPLPAIHGRVCYHPCESACNRVHLDSEVSIHAVERFLGDLALEHGWQFGGPPARTARRVLVVGAGPSGLSAAYHLARRGHEVEIRDVLVLDTEVYSNTGGQSSKATPLGAVAKFAAAGKAVPKKDLALQAIAYGNVYVARVAMGADPQQTLRALREAEAYEGPSLVIAYSHCIAHGIDMRNGMDQQYRAVASGHWPLMRYDPAVRAEGGNPFLLDSPRPRIALADYTGRELRYRILAQADPAEAERLLGLAQQEVNRRWATYEEMAMHGAERFPPSARRSD
jgi:pyruvate/2-oxoacid:ferredoxin oxidoreductase beta subunit